MAFWSDHFAAFSSANTYNKQSGLIATSCVTLKIGADRTLSPLHAWDQNDYDSSPV